MVAYISGEQKHIFLSLKRGSGVLSPGKCLNSALLLESFGTFSENKNK